MLLQAQNHGLRKILTMLKSAGLILQLTVARGGGVFICVKSIVASTELWVDEDYEMIAVEVKGKDPKYMWEIIGIYNAPNEGTLAIERLTACSLSTRNLTK